MTKKYIAAGLFCITLLVSSFFSISSNTGVNKYNMSPDVSQKIVGSKSIDFMVNRSKLKSLDDLTYFADLIVIGKVITDGEGYSVELGFKNAPLKEKATNGSGPIIYSVSHSQVEVEKVLYGKLDGKVITLGQLGQPDNDNGETKVKKGDRMLFILKKHPDSDSLYSSVSAEDALFIINSGNKLLSLSDDIVVAKYDGVKLNILVDDFKKAKKREDIINN